MLRPTSVTFRGPLTPHVDGFWSDLLRQGYSPSSRINHLRVAAHLSRWLEARALRLRHVSDGHVLAFLVHRRRRGCPVLSLRSLAPLLGYLRRLGLVRAPRTVVARSSADRFVRDYAEYLARERGLAASTIRHYSDIAKRFIAVRFGSARLNWNQLKPADLTTFVLREARRWSVGTCKYEVTALRSLMRYLHVSGQIRNDLAGCVPAVAGWRLAWLPKALTPDQARRVLRSCTARSAISRRDAAIVRLLLRLGLRVGDLAALTLDDLDWRSGEIILRGKGRRESRLPLPLDVGHVLAAYLRRGRPSTNSRRVFLRRLAPHVPLTTGGVIHAVRSVLRHAGVSGGAHVLRHTAATEMLRHGASLPEIGHVLRHRHVDTTAIYAKVDDKRLRMLAQPWPGSAA